MEDDLNSLSNHNFIDNKYISFQRKFLSLTKSATTHEQEDINSFDNHDNFLNVGTNNLSSIGSQNISGLSSKLSLGKVASVLSSSSEKLSKHNIGDPDPKDILSIFMFCKTHYLSDDIGDGLLTIIKQLFRNHPPRENFFLHRNMRSINRALNRALDSLYTSMDIHTTYPFKLRGGNNNYKREKVNRILNRNGNNEQFIIGSGISLDLMEIVSEFLVNHDFQDLDFHPVTDMRDGIRHYSRFATGQGYEKIYQEVQESCGTDVYPFCFQLAMDGTPVASGGIGNKSITPLYLRCLQVTSKSALNKETNTSLVGFTPSLTVR
jgi:hypothetical protein